MDVVFLDFPPPTHAKIIISKLNKREVEENTKFANTSSTDSKILYNVLLSYVVTQNSCNYHPTTQHYSFDILFTCTYLHVYIFKSNETVLATFSNYDSVTLFTV